MPEQILNKVKKRPSIPLRTQLKLWVISGGRCQFPGCPEFLLHDRLTLSEGNYSNISHIISWTASGPRGDIVLSPKLGKDISNLMLTCQVHGKLIDKKENIQTYTVDFLGKVKEEHENRIKIQTEIDVARKSTTVRLQANIRGRLASISQSDAYTALIAAGRYPNDEKGIHVDLSTLHYSADTSAWNTAMNQINISLANAFAVGNDQKKHEHLSVFALAPIPILVYLGFKLGNTIPADIYIKLRERPWHRVSAVSKLQFTFSRPKKKIKSQTVALSIAISGQTKLNEITKIVGKDTPMYEIKLKKAEIDQIESIEDLESFRKSYREAIDKIRECHGKKCKIHLFGAMPACAAVVCGREIIHGVDPSILVYEHMDQEEGFSYALTIN